MPLSQPASGTSLGSFRQQVTVTYLQQITALQDNARSRKAWRSSKDKAYFRV